MPSGLPVQVIVRDRDRSSPLAANLSLDHPAIIWLLCHYPDTVEVDERIGAAVRIYAQCKLPIWLYGSSSARYPDSVERLLKQKLVTQGIPSEAVLCSADVPGLTASLDTVQEAYNVSAEAARRGIRTLVCVSNRLQLLQVKALLRRQPLELIWIQTPLRDRRWWYVAGRLFLIPLAFAGIGRRFVPLVFIRWARANIGMWPF